jgi:hypothetical protein
MSKITQVGFITNNQNRAIEFLPQNEQFSSPKEKREIFFNLYNYYVEKERRLTREEMHNGANIYEVFKNKITALESGACCTLTPLNVTSFDMTTNYSIRGYNRSSTLEKSLNLRKKFINLIDFHGNKEVLFDLDDMFLHLVYERAKKVNPNSEVLLFEKSIVIKDPREEVSSTMLIPSYMKLERESIMSDPTIKSQMDEACRTVNETEIKQVFLVYPKHPKFEKHISVDLHNKVKLRDEEYRVKMIPYSFSFCTKKQKIKTKNRRETCQ